MGRDQTNFGDVIAMNLSGIANNPPSLISMFLRKMQEANYIAFDLVDGYASIVLYFIEPERPIEDGDLIEWSDDYLMAIRAGGEEDGFTYAFCRDTLIEKGDPLWEETKATVEMILL